MGSNGRMGLLPGINVFFFNIIVYIYIMLCIVILGYTMLSNVI